MSEGISNPVLKTILKYSNHSSIKAISSTGNIIQFYQI